MGGKAGKKIKTSRPEARASSSAHISGPAQPPDTIIADFGNDFTNDLTLFADWNFLDPIMPTFIAEDTTIKEPLLSRLYHHSRSFIGCFSCRLRKNIDYESFCRWKDDPTEQKTIEIAEIMMEYIHNYYDFITTAPPSGRRNINNYCCFRLADSISALSGIPFVITFCQRKNKLYHGRFASMAAETPSLVPGWEYRQKSILFIDDFITSGMTAKTCYEILRKYNNHVDGLIYCKY